MINFVIGIDPGKNTGYAVYDTKIKKIIERKTLDFWLCYNKIMADHHAHNATVKIIVECSITKVNWQQSKNAITSANIGGVYREAHLLAEGLTLAGFNVTKQHPQGKLNAKQFALITGIKTRTNEHERDAVMLCFQR